MEWKSIIINSLTRSHKWQALNQHLNHKTLKHLIIICKYTLSFDCVDNSSELRRSAEKEEEKKQETKKRKASCICGKTDQH
jgi:hypothetical protein